MRAHRFLLVGLVTLGLIQGLSACGGDDDDAPTESGPREVSSKHLQRYEADTPERTALEWWRDVQFGNSEGALDLYTDDAVSSEEDFRRQVSFAASSFVGVPEIVDVQKGGDLATLYMTVRPPGSEAPPRPLSLNLARVDGNWLIRDNQLMEQQVARVTRARQAAEEAD
jgi:hypothetical protein